MLQNVLNYLITGTVSVVIALVKGAVVFAVGWKLVNFIAKAIKKSKAFKRLDDGIETFLGSVIEIVLKAVVILTVISVLGVNLSAAVTALASVGLTFGLAFQGALSNFAGGFIILVFKPFKVGDYIDTHTDSGTVVSITIFHTKLCTPDNKVISIPNGTLSGSSVINYSAMPERRVDFQFAVEFGEDIEFVKAVLKTVALSQPTIIAGKGVQCELNTFGDSELNIILRMWVKSEDYWQTYFKVMKEVNEAFSENGIVVPYKQIDVHNK